MNRAGGSEGIDRVKKTIERMREGRDEKEKEKREKGRRGEGERKRDRKR